MFFYFVFLISHPTHTPHSHPYRSPICCISSCPVSLMEQQNRRIHPKANIFSQQFANHSIHFVTQCFDVNCAEKLLNGETESSNYLLLFFEAIPKAAKLLSFTPSPLVSSSIHAPRSLPSSHTPYITTPIYYWQFYRFITD